MRILVVEDEEALASALAEYLRDEFYAVDVAPDGPTADELADVNTYDLVILDWAIPAPSGIELLGRWRRQGKSMPVLMLTGRGGVEDRIGGLDTGADDYLTKPFSFGELSARVRSLLRRREKGLLTCLAADDLELDLASRTASVAGRTVELRPKEFAILEYLLRHVDEVVPRTALVEHVWDDSFDSFSNTVDVTVHRLRQKIDGEAAAPLLHTVKGVGYVLRSRRAPRSGEARSQAS
jgi:DNA-binding response OmpR family regulator